MIIDIFAHLIPRVAIEAFKRTGHPEAIRLDGEAGSNNNSHMHDLNARLTALDKLKIDTQAVSIPPAISRYVAPDFEVQVCQAINDGIASITNSSHGRLIGVASLPMSSPGDSLDELRRCVEQLGLKAVQLYSNIYGKPIDSAEFMPIYERIQHYDIPILIHPTDNKFAEWINEYWLLGILGWPFDTSLAISRLVFSGTMEKYPNLKIIAHHSGAMIPFFAERMRGHYERSDKAEDNRAASMRFVNFKKFYADTAVNGSVSALMCARSFFGADHILFGSDYPFGPEKGERWTSSEIKSVNEMPINQEEKQLIFEQNARRVFNIH